MIAWREKLTASSLHFLVTLSVAACAAALIFLVWYPEPFQTMLGGWKLFGLVVGCDIILGPLISLVIYNSKKSRRELVIDYTIVAAVQLAALLYGVSVVFQTRPVYVAFSVDRLEVVTANDIDDADFKEGKNGFTSRPLWGPQLIAAVVPKAADEHNRALFDAIAGKDAPLLPRYYTTYDSQRQAIEAHAKPLEDLTKQHPNAANELSRAVNSSGKSEEELRWLPVKYKRGFWTALLDANTMRPVKYLAIDPY
jgi:hypothetical protein